MPLKLNFSLKMLTVSLWYTVFGLLVIPVSFCCQRKYLNVFFLFQSFVSGYN